MEQNKPSNHHDNINTTNTSMPSSKGRTPVPPRTTTTTGSTSSNAPALRQWRRLLTYSRCQFADSHDDFYDETWHPEMQDWLSSYGHDDQPMAQALALLVQLGPASSPFVQNEMVQTVLDFLLLRQQRQQEESSLSSVLPLAVNVALHQLAQGGHWKGLCTLCQAMVDHRAATIDTLLVANDVLQAARDEQGKTPLHTAAIFSQWKTIVTPVLELEQSCASWTDHQGYTVFHWAVALGQVSWLQRQLPILCANNNNSNMTIPSYLMAPPLVHTALVHCQPACLSYLWKHQQPQHHDDYFSDATTGDTVWHVAARHGRIPLLRRQCDLQQMSEVSSSQHVAPPQYYETRVSAVNHQGQTPLHVLAHQNGNHNNDQEQNQQSQQQPLSWLVAQCPAALHHRDQSGHVPWRTAALAGHTTLAWELLLLDPVALKA